MACQLKGTPDDLLRWVEGWHEEMRAERASQSSCSSSRPEEIRNLRSRTAISSWGGRRYRPFAFTEYGAVQAANVLRSNRTVEMSLYVVRAFVQLREVLTSNKELAQRIDELERKLATHDQSITSVINDIRKLMNHQRRRGGDVRCARATRRVLDSMTSAV